MARSHTVILLALASSTYSLTTCPGFPGFCSESFPGQSCQVVCSAGRNNVPLCQDDGTWTDIPRCVEHEPGVEEQIPGLCPGVSGYCATGFLHGRCRFDCTAGPDIDSVCSADGTWAPYPTCQGDVRDLRDGCDGCPGPLGGKRNRTAEALLSQNTVSDRRVPKTITNDGGRKNVPSFAGNINIGPLESRQKNSESRRPQQQNRQQQQQQQQQQVQNPRQQQFQNPRQQQFSQQNTRQQQRFPQQNFRTQQQNTRQQFPQQNTRQQQLPRQNSLFAEQFPQNTQQQQQQQQPRPQPSQPNLSLFDQIKARAQGNRPEVQQPRQPQTVQQQPRQQQPRQQQTVQQQPRQQFQPQAAVERPTPVVARPRQQGGGGPQQTFGVFESVNLGGSIPQTARQQPRQQRRQQQQEGGEGFFGAFESVDLQG